MTVQQRKRIAAKVIAAGGSDNDAGIACGRAARTVRFWRERDPDFRALLAEARGETEWKWPGRAHADDDCDMSRALVAMSPLKGTRLGKR
jgi:hypothetical protein